jgi:hypothetical protein
MGNKKTVDAAIAAIKVEQQEGLVQNIRTKPVHETKKNKRDKDDIESPHDGIAKNVNGLINFMYQRPFMSLFEFCALQQNFSDHSREKCVFRYSVRHPKFYKWCRVGDFFVHFIISSVIIGIVIYSSYKILT